MKSVSVAGSCPSSADGAYHFLVHVFLAALLWVVPAAGRAASVNFTLQAEKRLFTVDGPGDHVTYYVAEASGHSIDVTFVTVNKVVSATQGTLTLSLRRVEVIPFESTVSDDPYLLTVPVTLRKALDAVGKPYWWGEAVLPGELSAKSCLIDASPAPNDGANMYWISGWVGTSSHPPDRPPLGVGDFSITDGGSGPVRYNATLDAAPVLTVTKPTAGGTVSTYVEISGTASDYQGVQAVRYSVADNSGKLVASGSASLATITVGTIDKVANVVSWTSGELFLPPGSFTVEVRAEDSEGNESPPVTRSFSVVPSSLTPGDFTAVTPTLSYFDPYVSPAPKLYKGALTGSFEGKVTKARLIAGNTVAGSRGKASGWWVASEITPVGRVVVTDTGGLRYYAATTTGLDAALLAQLGGSTVQQPPDTMLISPLVLASPPLLHPDGFTLVYSFSMQFYRSPDNAARGMKHDAVALRLQLQYERKEPGSPLLYRLNNNAALLPDLSQGDMADIMTLKTALLYPASAATFSSGWTAHEPNGAAINLTQQDRWNAMFSETANLLNNLVTTTPGQVKPLGHGTVTSFAFVARNRPDDFIKPVSSEPAMSWRRRDEEWLLDQKAVLSFNLWGAVRPEVLGGAVVLGTGGAGSPLVGADRVAPSVTITSPSANARVPYATSVSLVGTAADNVGVASVEVRSATSNVWTPAVVTTVGGKGVSWTATLSGLSAGPATVYARSRDAAGNLSSQTKLTFTLVRERTLSVAIVGGGGVSTGFIPSSGREAGKIYTIVATPAKGWRFKQWSGTGIPAGSSASTLMLTMPDADATLTAVFVTNTLAAVTGAYDVSIGQESWQTAGGVTVEPTDFGRLKINVTSTGSFTGTLTLASQFPSPRTTSSFSLSGMLDGADSYTTVLKPAGKPATTLTFSLGLDAAGLAMCEGRVQMGVNSPATFTGFRIVPYTAAQPCPQAGRYHVCLDGAVNSKLYTVPYIVASPLCPCEGWGTVLVDSLGHTTAALRGPLQGAPVTFTGGITELGEFSFAGAMPLGHKSLATGLVNGFCAGYLMIDSTDSIPYGWIRWLPMSAPTPAFSDDHHIDFEVTGQRYQSAGTGVPILGWTAGVVPNAFFECRPGELAASVFKRLSLTASNTLQSYEPTTGGFTLKLDATTGSMSGTIAIPGRTGSQTFSGVAIGPDEAIGSIAGGFVRLTRASTFHPGLVARAFTPLSVQTLSHPELSVPGYRKITGFNPPAGGFTFSTWLAPDVQITGTQEIMRQGIETGAVARKWRLVRYTANVPPLMNIVRLEVTGPGITGTASIQGGIFFPISSWTAVTIVGQPEGSGFQISLYLDGTHRGDLALPDAAAFQTGAPLILADSLDGTIADTQLWGRVLSDEEILSIPSPLAD